MANENNLYTNLYYPHYFSCPGCHILPIYRRLLSRFPGLHSRVPDLPDAETRLALVRGLNPEVQVHVLRQHHVTSLVAALE